MLEKVLQFDINHSNIFLDQSPKAKEVKAKKKKKNKNKQTTKKRRDVIKLKSFCTTKETINKTK